MWRPRSSSQQGDDYHDDDKDDERQQPTDDAQIVDGPVSIPDTVKLYPHSPSPSPPPFPSPSPPKGRKYRTFPPGTHDGAESGASPLPQGKTLPPDKRGHTMFVYVLTCLAAVGGLLFGYDTGIISGSMLLIQPYFRLSTLWQELIVSGTIAAAALASLLGGLTLLDKVGRKRVIMGASLVFTLGAVVMGVAPNKETLLVGRIIVGLGIGLASVTMPVYIAELSPPDIRGRLVTFVQLFITVGILLSSIVAGALSVLKETGWRYMLGLAAAPGVLQFIGFLFMPESPRWLVSKDRDDEARRVLRRTRGYEDVEEEMSQIIEAEKNKQTGFALGQMLKTPHVRRALFIGCGVQFFQQMCGVNTVIYYSGTILKEAGFHVGQAIWLVTVPFAINFLSTFIGLFSVERFGRKRLLITSFLGVTVAQLILSGGFLVSILNSPSVNTTIVVLYDNGSRVTDQCQGFSICEDCIDTEHCGYCYDADQPQVATCALAQPGDEDNSAFYGYCSSSSNSSSKQSPVVSAEWTFGFCPTSYGWMAVLGLALFVFSFAPGLGPTPWIINSEIYPMWARGTGMALATMTNWACNLFVSFTFLTLFQAITKYGTFFMFTGISLLGLTFTALLVPETRNKTLEEMEQVFMSPREQTQRQYEQQQQQEEATKRPPFSQQTLDGDGVGGGGGGGGNIDTKL